MTALADRVDAAIREELLADRVWFYANYHCNLTCTYCLTESSPRSPRRELDLETMVAVTGEARDLGFRRIGVTGGEMFMRADMPEVLAAVSAILPTVALTNGTLFTDRLFDRLAPLVGAPLAFQISLDSAEPDENDAFRGDENFAKVVAAIPELLARGHRVRIATTVEHQSPAELEQLCALHRSLGVSDDDHVVRAIVHRGRASDNDLGVAITTENMFPEPTVTADGLYWNPFGATVRGGRMDTDFLVTRQVVPLARGVEAMLSVISGRPAANDALLGIR